MLIFGGTVNGALAAKKDQHPYAVIWAWHRAEHLQYINPQKFGVAFLRQTLTLNGDRISISPRQQPLVVPKNTSLWAVTRIEIDDSSKPNFTDEQARLIADRIVSTASTEMKGVQIDFDARLSERSFYKMIVSEVRKLLPPEKTLSVTALASWCTYDPWLQSLPVDEIVPMYFSMGADTKAILDYLTDKKPLQPGCVSCTGVAVDNVETAKSVLRSRGKETDKVYFFSTKPWSESRYRTAESLLSD